MSGNCDQGDFKPSFLKGEISYYSYTAHHQERATSLLGLLDIEAIYSTFGDEAHWTHFLGYP